MLLRVPNRKIKADDQYLEINNTPYALFTVEKTTGKKNVFLTEHTLMFVLNGAKIIHLGDESHFFGNDDLVFLKKGIYVMSEFIPENENFEVLLVYVPDHVIRKFHSKFSHKTDIDAAKKMFTCKLDHNLLLQSFIQQYKHLFGIQNSNSQYILENRLEELFLILSGAKAGKTFLHFLSSLVNPKADIEFIVNENLFQPIAIDDFAKLSGRSLPTFKREFEQHFHTSPRKWINQQRLKRASEMLKNTNLNVSEVAFECGYEHVSHFIRIYKAEFGETPSETKKAIF
ncbi:AraC family transcriptional regulator [Sphingobacterium sp. SRCM116780]|uniref:helix-turn-helix transcriptional regulator n=1 Tax=Sphingobacterium sp. SRCM116780 TaxID=2907623 RepID=UPI001F2BB118|nr:helix-turn-helix domain-containing protein [Sphingobacterium sp. SRCM116780]UIR57542.1 AraC family transcriptional regulator [Sphingobacterium sp. SRCM116780]